MEWDNWPNQGYPCRFCRRLGHEEVACPAERMKGPWIRTFVHNIVNPLDLIPGDIHILDLAQHLATSNRFVGALRYPVSIAQHSVCVARLVQGWAGKEWALYGLLHDASEAYLGDVSKWLKASPSMSFYREAEDRAQAVIFERFGLKPMKVDEVPELERADRLMVRVEGQLGFDIPELIPGNDRYKAVTDAEWEDVQKYIGPLLIAEMDWRNAKFHFLNEYRELTRIK